MSADGSLEIEQQPAVVAADENKEPVQDDADIPQKLEQDPVASQAPEVSAERVDGDAPHDEAEGDNAEEPSPVKPEVAAEIHQEQFETRENGKEEEKLVQEEIKPSEAVPEEVPEAKPSEIPSEPSEPRENKADEPVVVPEEAQAKEEAPPRSREQQMAEFLTLYMALQDKWTTGTLTKQEEEQWEMVKAVLGEPKDTEPVSVEAEAESIRIEGDTAFENQNYELALLLYNKADGLLPNQPAVLSHRSAANREVGNLEAFDSQKALADARAVVSLKPDWFRGYQRLQSALTALGRDEEAEDALRAGIAKCSEGTATLTNSLNNLLELRLAKGQPAAAEPVPVQKEEEPVGNAGIPAAETQAADVLTADQHREAGNAAFLKKEYMAALESYNQAFALNPSDERVVGNRAATQYSLGNYELALQDALLAVQLKPSWFRGHQRLVQSLKVLRGLDEAEAACLVGLQHCPAEPNLTELLKGIRAEKELREQAKPKEPAAPLEPVAPSSPSSSPPAAEVEPEQQAEPEEAEEDNHEEEISKYDFDGEDFQDFVEEAWVRSRMQGQAVEEAVPVARHWELISYVGAAFAGAVAIKLAAKYFNN